MIDYSIIQHLGGVANNIITDIIDIMKRYRVLNIDFDSRAAILKMVIDESWEENVKSQCRINKQNNEISLLQEFGSLNGKDKLKNFCDIGSAPVSIVAFHNKFLRQIRRSFVIGSYYPALTGACSLGERILNHLIVNLRNDFKKTKEYKRVYRKDSFDDWPQSISILSSWGILLPTAAQDYLKLADIRNKKAIHFNPETDTNDRDIALEAINVLSSIIQEQFGAYGKQPWFIENTKGEFFIKKEYERHPFINKIYIPNCSLVGPYHKLEWTSGGWAVIDSYAYEEKDITDEEYVILLNDFRDGKISL